MTLQEMETAGHDETPVKAISVALYAAGVTQRKAQAAIVGEGAEQWGRYLNTERSPTCAKVQRWLVTAMDNGHDIALSWDFDGCVSTVQ